MALTVAVLAAPDLSGQAVAGRLVDASSGVSVSGALIVLLGDEGAEVATTVTTARGTYHVRAPGAGVYRVRAERIGFESTLTEPFTLLTDRTLNRELTASSAAVALPALAVESEAVCRLRPDEGEATYVLWEEARKALRMTERAAADYRFEAVMYERLVNMWGEPLEPADENYVSLAGRHPFRSAPVDRLEAEGYARRAAEGTYYYGPDAEVLLSDPFLDSHCFRYRGGPDDRVVGLAFEPVREATGRVDVRGVLWLDRETAKLRTLEFQYTGVPRPAVLGQGPGPYGRMVFDQVPDGSWIVREWWIRTPAGSRERGVQRYVTYSQEGGRVSHVEPLHGHPIDTRPVPSVYGPPAAPDSADEP